MLAEQEGRPERAGPFLLPQTCGVEFAPPIVVEKSCTTLAPPKWQGSYRSASFSSPHENRFAGFSRGPRWSCQRKPSRGPSRRCAAHLGGPCTVEEKAAWSKLARPGKFGDAAADSQLSADLPSFIQVRCNAPLHPRLCRKLSRLIKFQGACRNALPLAPLPLHGDGFQRKGPQSLPSGRSGKRSRGKPSRKGFPLASLWGRRVSLGERNGSRLPNAHRR